MDKWFINPITKVMISVLPNGTYLLGVPNRSVEAYAAEDVEHVVLHTPRPVVLYGRAHT